MAHVALWDGYVVLAVVGKSNGRLNIAIAPYSLHLLDFSPRLLAFMTSLFCLHGRKLQIDTNGREREKTNLHTAVKECYLYRWENIA